jgi:hypothetical protein
MENSGKAKKGAERYLDFLAEEGFRPRINENGDVAFKYEGGSYVIRIDENDEMYFCLVFPNFWRIESVEELSRVKEIALAVTAEYKVLKIIPVVDFNTSATVQLFCSPPETFKEVFYRCLRAICAAVKEFSAKMQELPKPADDFVFHLSKYKVGSN